MPVPDNKKVQTLINEAADQITAMRAAMAKLKDARTRFQAANPSVTGTALQGNTATVSNAIDALDAELNKAVWDGLIAAKVHTHKKKAL